MCGAATAEFLCPALLRQCKQMQHVAGINHVPRRVWRERRTDSSVGAAAVEEEGGGSGGGRGGGGLCY